MNDENWVSVAEVPGMLQAELLRGLLEAEGIEVLLSQEGAGRALGLTIGTLGTVEILVREQDVERVQQALDDYYAAMAQENQDEETPPE